MSINWFILSILIVISFLVSIKKKFKYIDAFVFFIPFNATILFFTPDKTAINLPFVLFILATISFFLRRIFNSKFAILKNRLNLISWLVVLGIIVLISQIMPFVINGSYSVLDRYNESIFYAKDIALYPSLQWLTQSLYFIVGLLVIFIINQTYRTISEIKRGLKFLLLGIVFMIFWGWIGDLTYFLGAYYPQLFNQIGMNEFGIHDFKGFPRMASVTMEASYFAQLLIPATPFFYWFSQQKNPLVFNRSFNKALYIISIITLPLAITTTGILGFIVLMGLWLKNNLRYFNVKSKYFLTILYLVIIAFSIIFIINYLVDVSGTYSGIERFKTVDYGARYFIDYPILGLGFGVFPTYDLIINLLVNFGIIGTIPFLILMYNIYANLRAKLKSANKEIKPLYAATLESFILILIVSQLSGFIYHSQYFWLYVGFASTVGYAEMKRKNIK